MNFSDLNQNVGGSFPLQSLPREVICGGFLALLGTHQRATAVCAEPVDAVGCTHPEAGCALDPPKKLVSDQTAKWDSALFSPVISYLSDRREEEHSHLP